MVWCNIVIVILFGWVIIYIFNFGTYDEPSELVDIE